MCHLYCLSPLTWYASHKTDTSRAWNNLHRIFYYYSKSHYQKQQMWIRKYPSRIQAICRLPSRACTAGPAQSYHVRKYTRDSSVNDEDAVEDLSSHTRRMQALENDPATSWPVRELVHQRKKLISRQFESITDIYTGPTNPHFKRFALRCWPPLDGLRESTRLLTFLETMGRVLQFRESKQFAHRAVGTGYFTVTFDDPADEVYDRLFLAFEPFIDVEKFNTYENQERRWRFQQADLGVRPNRTRMFDIERHPVSVEQYGLERVFETADFGSQNETTDFRARKWKQAQERLVHGFDGFVKN
ncbi:hypothetical protein V1525DRAFT_410915 [Lipomyces kononenkoae]|uniref:Uncharacterized protein n=1 Tax=Lipomyces kononenkoae TaxID=34357 RepID=A0ACC3SU28_LIPKO